MKIAVWHNLPSGGGKRALYNHIKALNERGHYIEVWTTDSSDHDYLPLNDFVIEHQIPVKNSINKIKNIKFPIKRTIKEIKILKNLSQRCIEKIEKKNFDILFVNSCMYSNMPYLGLYSSIPSALYLGEPLRYLHEATENNNIWQFPELKRNIRSIYRLIKDLRITYANRIILKEEIQAAKSYDKILVNSLYSRESLLKAYGIDSTLCYLGVDENQFIITNNEKKNYIVGLGKIVRHKNINKTIEIIAHLPLNIRPTLKWISNGYDIEYLNEVKIIAEKSKVHFVPMINLSDIELYDTLSQACIMLYLPHLEPFGLAPIEANMCGTYVIAIAEGGIRESIINGINGTLINGFNIKEFVGAIQNFLTDLEFSKKMGLQAREFALKTWNWEKMANNIERALLQIIDE